MAQKLSTEQLAAFLAGQLTELKQLETEVEQIHVGFNGAYGDFKARHDATLAALTEQVQAQYEAVCPTLRGRMETRRAQEREQLTSRRQALRDKEVPAARTAADERLRTAQQAGEARARQNPLLNEQEERQKAELTRLTAQMDGLNGQIGRLRAGLGFLTRYGAIVKLDRQRHQVIGQIETTRKQLNDVRLSWKKTVDQEEGEVRRLQGEWQQLALQAAKLQDELDYLDDDSLREALAQRQAIFAVLDETNDPAACAGGALYDQIQAMIRLNIQTDNYQAGLGTVAGVIGLLRGLQTGFESFRTSVDAIAKEQSMHGQYLGKLSFQLPDQVATFAAQWEPLRKKLSDEGRLAKYPLEFVAIVQPALDATLSQASIEGMFKALGAELQRATAGWKG